MSSFRVPAHKLPRGDTRRCPRLLKVTAACVLLVAVAGCGENEGAASGATARAYVAGPLCAGAEKELARHGGEAGDVHVRAICLPRVESLHKLDLAQIGANARRATEDSTAVGYIGEPTRAASRFSEPILETAGIAQLSQISGVAAMKKLLDAVAKAGNSGSLRQSVNDELE
ncbi:MAG TPA: hypothetical protein VLK56_08640, partial [Solirubrobacterales bacterium]|nr:hypothetical protein [Solirubrobacterales bacterium]